MISINNRGDVQFSSEKCFGCAACEYSCPVGCIKMQDDADGFVMPVFEKVTCIKCGRCAAVCPAARDYPVFDPEVPTVFAACSEDKKLLEASSSGGVFSALAEQIIADNGIVLGAAFDENLQLRHVAACSAAGLASLRGSKYVQSDMRRAFSIIAENLAAGKKVLFSGVPCQAAAVRAVFGEHPGLLVCDILCHGAASPGVWDGFVRELEIRYQAKIRNVNFRKKTGGWRGYALSILFENGRKYEVSGADNLFMNSYVAGLFMRSCCYGCKLSGKKRQGDLTLGDYWGIWDTYPELYNEQGVSAVIVNNDKGSQLFQSCTAICRKATALAAVARYNHSLVRGAGSNFLRKPFLNRFFRQGRTLKRAAAFGPFAIKYYRIRDILLQCSMRIRCNEQK